MENSALPVHQYPAEKVAQEKVYIFGIVAPRCIVALQTDQHRSFNKISSERDLTSALPVHQYPAEKVAQEKVYTFGIVAPPGKSANLSLCLQQDPHICTSVHLYICTSALCISDYPKICNPCVCILCTLKQSEARFIHP